MSPIDFFRRELAPNHKRFVEAARNATKTAITTGLAATMQILGPFGPLFAFRIGQPGISLGFFEGVITIAFAAAMQAAIVPITGKLLDYPGLVMAFLFLVFATMGYLLSNTRLFMILALVAVGTITTVYVGIFEPGQIGWGSTYTFDGILIATLVMVVIDTLIWPSPPEPRLLASIAADMERTRGRLELVGQRYLDPFAASLPPPQVAPMLARNLTLLKPVKEQMKPTPHHFAALIDAVMTAEHAYLEVERLAVLADEPSRDELKQDHREEIEVALRALDRALAQRAEEILAGLLDPQESEEWVSDLRVNIRRLSQLSTQTLLASDEVSPSCLSNLLGFIDGLEAIGNLLDSHERPPGSAGEDLSDAEAHLELRPFFDPVAFRFSIKLGAAITLGLIVGLTTQRADLQTILWSTVVAGQPNQYGAVIRKTILRLGGCVLGGLAALAAMILVSENFDSLPPYLLAIFAVAMFSTYVSQSSEWLGYAGIQAGITFLVCYVGLAPSSNIYEPLWRFWGIVLGVLTTGFVFLFLWPEYASDKVVASLKRLMRTTLELANDVTGRGATDGRPSVIERHLSTDLLQVLNMADQARLEGTRGREVSKAAFEAAGFLIRIAYRFQTITRARLAGSERQLSDQLRQRCAALERAFCHSLESGLEKLRPVEPFEELTAQEVPAESSEQNLNDAELLSRALIRDADCAPYAHADWTTQLEAYRRMPILLSRLDSALSNIAVH